MTRGQPASDRSDDDDSDDNDSNECREVYARFGVAYYLAECVHRGLVQVFAVLPYDKTTAARPWIAERDLRASKMPLGELATQTRHLLPDTLHARLDWAVERRNYLAHGFWWDHTHEMVDANGRADLLGFLLDTADRFRELSGALDEMVRIHLRRFGVSPEMFLRAATEARGQAPDAPVDRRVPKTDDRLDIVHAWLVGKDGSEMTGLVLLDRDGLGWQLAEDGLGWCFLAGPQPNWEVFEALQRHLPAAIVARPKGARKWDYKLHLSTGPLLAVSRAADGILRFTVRAAKGTRR